MGCLIKITLTRQICPVVLFILGFVNFKTATQLISSRAHAGIRVQDLDETACCAMAPPSLFSLDVSQTMARLVRLGNDADSDIPALIWI